MDALITTKIKRMTHRHNLVPVYVPASDESTDDEIQLRTSGGIETGLAVQISGRFYTATDWDDDDQAMWFGPEHVVLDRAIADVLARFTLRCR